MVPSSEPTEEDEQESAISVSPPQRTSAAALVTVGNEHVEGSQMTEAKLPSEQTDSSVLAEYPVAQATVREAELANSVSPLPNTSAAALVMVGNEQA